MAKIHDLAARREKLKKEMLSINDEIERARKQELTKLRARITTMCSDAGFTLEDLFGVDTTRSGFSTGPHKYIYDGVAYDGRAARTMDEFESVIEDGAINDLLAIKQQMINPAWLKSDNKMAQQFRRQHGL